MRKRFDLVGKVFVITAGICFQFVVGRSQGHQAPIPFELFLGQEALYSQLVLTRDFSPSSKFSFFNLSTYSADYQDQEENDLVMINQVSYELGKGIDLIAGGNMNAAVGFSPIVGMKQVYASRKMLAVSILSYSIDGSHDLSFLGIYEFKPPINDQLAVYTRCQFLYEHSFSEGHHNRSFLYLRAGLKKNKFNFGVGANLDQYGPQKRFKDNYGLFVMREF